MSANAVQTPIRNQITRSEKGGPQMARTTAKLEKEITRLEGIRDTLATQEAEAAGELARLSAAMAAAMVGDDIGEADKIEREAQAADGKRTSAARRRDAVSAALRLLRDELDAVRSGDALKAAQRRHAGGEQAFEAARRELHDAIKQASTALGEMNRSYREARQAADELHELGEETPGLYAYDVKESRFHLQRLRDEATRAALEAVNASSPEFTWDVRLAAAAPAA